MKKRFLESWPRIDEAAWVFTSAGRAVCVNRKAARHMDSVRMDSVRVYNHEDRFWGLEVRFGCQVIATAGWVTRPAA
jgi:hypothetical protein